MKPTFNIILLILAAITLSAQKYDYNWYTGYDLNDSFDFPFGITHIDFNTEDMNPKFVIDTNNHYDFAWTINNVSDFEGNFLFNYNGAYLFNHNYNKIPNGQLTMEDPFEVFNQMAVIIPSNIVRNEYNIFYKIYHSYGGEFAGSENILSSKISIDRLTEGKVINKSKILVQDTLQLIDISSIQHANGQDWWIITFEYWNSNYYALLMRDQKILKTLKASTENYKRKINMQTAFSKDGNYFAMASIYPHFDSTISSISLFKFDRSTGVLSELKNYHFDDLYLYNYIGVAFSPNSKYLYIPRKNEILQVDLTDSLYPIEKIAEYDGFLQDLPKGGNVGTKFGLLQNAPDGRIYGTTSGGTQRYLYYINKPNLKGKACDVRQHAIKITMHANLPTFPNYRLGPIDGSPSDSLGIDNIPVAEFRYDQDTMNYRSIDFTNLSWYEPEEFWWDWGDGSQPYNTTVWDTSIIHTYAKDGIYEVCLRAKNKNGETTKCKKINIGTTATKDAADNPEINITLSPNPMREILIIQVNDYLPEKMIMNLYDLQGNKITTKRLYEGSNIINTESFSSGVYIVEIIERNRIVKSEKIVKN